MTEFQAQRVSRTFAHTVDAPPADVFPLLCPVREYEWIDGWSCEMIYSESGKAENNCIFTTNFPGEGQRIWTVSKYDPENFAIEFVIMEGRSLVCKLDVALTEREDGTTEARWTRTFTGLDEAGNGAAAAYSEAAHAARMRILDASLNHFCRAGELLTRESWPVDPALLHSHFAHKT